jgi:hypothetical protein
MQGSSDLLADSLTLCRGESPTTAHTMTWVIHKLRQMITKLPINTEPSRWWRSPRATSTNSHLTKISLMKKVDAHPLLPICTNEVLNLGLSNLNHPTRLLLSLTLQSIPQLNKWARKLSWTSRRSIYTPHFKTYLLGSNSANSRWLDAPVHVIGRVQQVANGYIASTCQRRLLERPDALQHPILLDLTRQVLKFSLWTLSNVDRTLQYLRPVTSPSASDPVSAPKPRCYSCQQLRVQSWSWASVRSRWGLGCTPCVLTGLCEPGSGHCTLCVRSVIHTSVHFQIKILCEWSCLKLIFRLSLS